MTENIAHEYCYPSELRIYIRNLFEIKNRKINLNIDFEKYGCIFQYEIFEFYGLLTEYGVFEMCSLLNSLVCDCRFYADRKKEMLYASTYWDYTLINKDEIKEKIPDVYWLSKNIITNYLDAFILPIENVLYEERNPSDEFSSCMAAYAKIAR